VWEILEEERCCDKVKPDQPVPRTRIRGFEAEVEGELKKLWGTFRGVDKVVVVDRGRLKDGCEVGAEGGGGGLAARCWCHFCSCEKVTWTRLSSDKKCRT
jgi:hypothetical protein